MPIKRSTPAILATVCVAVLAINLNTTIVNIALPTLSRDLDATTRDLLRIVDGYNLAFAALVLAAGSMSDKFGRRPALVVGLFGFGLASLAAALVDTSGALIATRFAAGICAAVIFPTTLSVIANAYTNRKQRAAALGVWGAATGIGVAAGPVAGGWLLDTSPGRASSGQWCPSRRWRSRWRSPSCRSRATPPYHRWTCPAWPSRWVCSACSPGPSSRPPKPAGPAARPSPASAPPCCC